MGKEYRDLFLGYISFGGSILTICYIIYSGIKSETSFDFSATLTAVCLMNVFLAGAAIFIVRKYDRLLNTHNKSGSEIKQLDAEIDSLNSAHKTIAKVFHNINHQSRNLIEAIFNDITSRNYSNFKETEAQFKKHIIYLLDNVKEIFDVVTKDQCGVCIKIIIPNEKNTEQSHIKTHYRDSISYRERSAIDGDMETYPYYENTAFKRIINKNYPDTYYFCNDLKKEQTYTNANPSWQKFYNACLVVPISFPHKEKGEKTQRIMIGFICVDNFKGGFDDAVTHNLLSAIADQHFIIYKTFSELKNASKLNSLTPT